MPRPPSTSQQAVPTSQTPCANNGRPTNSPAGTAHKSAIFEPATSGTSKASTKRKRNRHRKRRNRRQSFLSPEESRPSVVPERESMDVMTTERTRSHAGVPFYKLGGGDLSTTSLESEALLDHRNQPMMQTRRESRPAQLFKPGSLSTQFKPPDSSSRSHPSRGTGGYGDESDVEEMDDQTPLMRPSSSNTATVLRYGTDSKSSPYSLRQRRQSTLSDSSRCSPHHDINNPPSMPTSPNLGPDMGYNDAVMTGTEFDFSLARSLDNRLESARAHDLIIDVEGSLQPRAKTADSSPTSPNLSPHEGLLRRRTLPAEEDVCFPREDVSEMAEGDGPRVSLGDERRRRRAREWPDLSVLEDWSREEKEDRTGGFRTKKISEPMFVEGRLRPQYRLWRREEDEAPYRFTYFNEEFQSTIHAQTISELVQPGSSFRELFIPDPPELEESSDEENATETDHRHSEDTTSNFRGSHNTNSLGPAYRLSPSIDPNQHPSIDQKSHPRSSIISDAMSEARGNTTPLLQGQQLGGPKPKRYGPRPTFWLDILCPTDAEMRVIAKAFNIHALTAEDIMMQEAREKVELFRNYYFVNYRTFEQDPNNENYLQPVNMYVVVFRDGVLSFHFSQTPHPANVRRRIRQLMDYLILSSDWISYALIDDITDVFGPLIQAIEDEVDEIDEMIMGMHSHARGISPSSKEEEDQADPGPGEMLRRVGVCRKKVMGMYRLLSNKADVVKGFAKRCNEHWEVAPKSEIGLYLGDIQDHIMTMTSSLTYYETLLSRAHTNYLAQINILMNERQEQTADVLGKLTVLGTIVLPLNIICGMWGMNVKVPGQDVDSLWWFYSIVGGLFLFAFSSFLIAKRVYKIV